MVFKEEKCFHKRNLCHLQFLPELAFSRSMFCTYPSSIKAKMVKPVLIRFQYFLEFVLNSENSVDIDNIGRQTGWAWLDLAFTFLK